MINRLSAVTVVDTGHMLGLDQEREELGEIMSCIYVVIHLLTMSVYLFV